MHLPIAFAAMLCASPGFADPGHTTRKLMDTSPSMLDFGILRLDVHLDFAWATYDWKNDDINIFPEAFGLSGEDCKEFIERSRLRAGYIGPKGELDPNLAYSIFAALFSHEGYILGGKENQEKLLQELDQKILVKCHTATALYTARLPGKEISVTEKVQTD